MGIIIIHGNHTKHSGVELLGSCGERTSFLLDDDRANRSMISKQNGELETTMDHKKEYSLSPSFSPRTAHSVNKKRAGATVKDKRNNLLQGSEGLWREECPRALPKAATK